MTFQYKGGTIEELFASPADWISPDCGDGYKQTRQQRPGPR